MIDRALIIRGFLLLALIATGGVLVATLVAGGDTGGEVVDAADVGGTVFEEPGSWRRSFADAAWIGGIPVHGGVPFGRAVARQVRVEVDGTGAMPDRAMTLRTPAAVQLFRGGRRARAEAVLRGTLHVLEERGGLVRGLSLTEDRASFEAAALGTFVEQRALDGLSSSIERAWVTEFLRRLSRQQAAGTLAWYEPNLQDIALGPEISVGLLRYIRTPGRAKPGSNLFAAYVLRHELEHAVTPAFLPADSPYRWLEEGTADVLARWPGQAADTARTLGMPYPARYDAAEYRTDRGGYPEWTQALRILLGAAGADWRDPDAFSDAADLLQSVEVRRVPALLADRIADRNRLDGARARRLEQRILAVDGSPAAARQLAASLRGAKRG